MIRKKKRRRILSLLALEGAAWRHPWHTKCRWNNELERWEANINPATLVNALEPVVTLPFEEAPETTRLRLEASGQSGGDVDAWLSEKPMITLEDLRAIGGDAGPSGTDASGQLAYEGVPEFFAARGVRAPTKVVIEGESITQDVTDLMNGSGKERLLRACELVLFLDRQATRTEWTTGSGLDGVFAQFSVTTFDKPGKRERGYIRVRSTWSPPQPGTAQDLLRGEWEEDPTDQYHIGTVYLLSPPGVTAGTEPDGSWAPFVKHSLWWNLHHAVNQLEPALAKVDLRLQTGLAGGVGDAVNQFILAQVNDANSAASEFLGRERVESRRWTA